MSTKAVLPKRNPAHIIGDVAEIDPESVWKCGLSHVVSLKKRRCGYDLTIGIDFALGDVLAADMMQVRDWSFVGGLILCKRDAYDKTKIRSGEIAVPEPAKESK